MSRRQGLASDDVTIDLPDDFTTRPLSADDAPAVATLLAAAEAVDATGEHPDAQDLAEQWVNDLVDLPRDGLAVLDDTGAVVGYATTIAPPTFRDAYGVHLEGRVHPACRGRGVGRALLDWQLTRGAELHAQRHPEATARLTVTAHTTMPDLEDLLRRAGMEQLRWFHHMERPTTDLPAVPDAPGLDFVAFDWSRDEEVRHAHNAAFTEHYGSSERDETSWRVIFTGRRSFRPELSVLALDHGAVVGYVLAYVSDSSTRANGERQAYYGQIGVLPAARGRGLSKAMIARALRVAAENDCATAGLEVDGENSSGAQRLYSGLGFVETHTQVSWSRVIPPLG